LKTLHQGQEEEGRNLAGRRNARNIGDAVLTGRAISKGRRKKGLHEPLRLPNSSQTGKKTSCCAHSKNTGRVIVSLEGSLYKKKKTSASLTMLKGGTG